MSFSKREFENQQSTLESRLARVRAGVETALRATGEGSLDLFTIYAICISLHAALRQLSAVEANAARLDREAEDENWPDADERNW